MMMIPELELFKAVAAVVRDAGPYGIVAYLVWRDLVQPWRNGKPENGKPENGKPATGPAGNGFARETDVTNLAQSFREYRADSWDRLQDIGDRLSRIEGRLEPRGPAA